MNGAFTPKRLLLEEQAKKRIVEVLEEYGCKVRDIKIDETLSLTEFDSKTKRAFKEFLGTKFDLLVARAKTGEYYLVECKGKSKEAFKNWVNVAEYDAYFKIASTPFPFLYFIWVKETNEIYRHEITNPQDFKVKHDRYNKPIYLIPEELIHAIKPSWLRRLDVWLRLKPKDIEKWIKEMNRAKKE